MIVDKHAVASINIVGSSLDVLGALYLAYDLLGGEHGPLRTLTCAASGVFKIGDSDSFRLLGATGVAFDLQYGRPLDESVEESHCQAWSGSVSARRERYPLIIHCAESMGA